MMIIILLKIVPYNLVVVLFPVIVLFLLTLCWKISVGARVLVHYV